MAFDKVLLVALILVVEVVMVISEKEALESDNSRLNEDVRYAGTADGKTFFAVFTNETTPLTWSEAKEACTAISMKLAEITSKAQADAIRLFANTGSIWDLGYWVAGRDAWEHRQFSWSSTNEEVSEDIGNFTSAYLPLPLSCIFFYPCRGCSGAMIYAYACTGKMSYRLCELPA